MELSQTDNVPVMEELFFSEFEMRIIKCLTLTIYKPHSLRSWSKFFIIKGG